RAEGARQRDVASLRRQRRPCAGGFDARRGIERISIARLGGRGGVAGAPVRPRETARRADGHRRPVPRVLQASGGSPASGRHDSRQGFAPDGRDHQRGTAAGASMRNERPVDNVLDTIGWTPLIRLNRVTRGVKTPVYAKAEYFNPGGSIKDRIGLPI